jgi:hypothetical protein
VSASPPHASVENNVDVSVVRTTMTSKSTSTPLKPPSRKEVFATVVYLKKDATVRSRTASNAIVSVSTRVWVAPRVAGVKAARIRRKRRRILQ